VSASCVVVAAILDVASRPVVVVVWYVVVVGRIDVTGVVVTWSATTQVVYVV
jgi:hypothetical protein